MIEGGIEAMTLTTLKRQARDTAQFRGHILGNFKNSYNSKTRAMAVCKECWHTVIVDTKPAPNGIDISGEVVAVHCRGRL